uniref:Uncharacterized protein n=1 Tax=Ixodes ricinus TaxID=34613 RepID=A0A147BTP5_IXORI
MQISRPWSWSVPTGASLLRSCCSQRCPSKWTRSSSTFGHRTTTPGGECRPKRWLWAGRWATVRAPVRSSPQAPRRPLPQGRSRPPCRLRPPGRPRRRPVERRSRPGHRATPRTSSTGRARGRAGYRRRAEKWCECWTSGTGWASRRTESRRTWSAWVAGQGRLWVARTAGLGAGQTMPCRRAIFILSAECTTLG